MPGAYGTTGEQSQSWKNYWRTEEQKQKIKRKGCVVT